MIKLPNKPIVRHQLIGAIDEDALKAFMKVITKHRDNQILLHLSSTGGSAYDALAIASAVRLHKNITVAALGAVQSAAVIILAAAKERMMAKESWVMVHEDSGKIKGDVSLQEREIAHLRRMENQWAELLAEYSKGKSTAETWAQLHKQTTYLSAQECLDLGLIDRII